MTIKTGMKVSVSSPPPVLKSISPHRPLGLSFEDYILVYGHPKVVDNLVKVETLVSCEGYMLSSGTGVMDIDTGAPLRFSAESGVTLNEWLPFRDDTWNSPRFSTTVPLYTEEVSWIRHRNVCRFPAVFINDTLTLTNPVDFQSGSMSVVMAVSPAAAPSEILFDDVTVTIRDGNMTVSTPQYTTWREASTGSDITLLGFRYSEGMVDVYVKSGYEPVTRTRFPGNSEGNISIYGPMGLLTVDAWVQLIDLGPVMDTLMTSLSGGAA